VHAIEFTHPTGWPQSLRPGLAAIGRAKLLLTVAIAVLGVLLSAFLRD
jgi:hypothetical protein